MAKGCDQCEVLSINGLACHEFGCPNRHIDPVTGRKYVKNPRPKKKTKEVIK